MSELKLSEVNKLNDRFRFDAEFFRKEYLNIENKLQKHNFKRLIDIESRIIHPSEIKREYVEKDGVWFFRTQNIRPLKIEESNNVFISKEDAHSLAKNLIKKGDVLITRTGANFGQTALYNIDKIAIGSSHTFILRNEYFKQAYLAVFLNTSFGRKLIDKGMYGGSQPEIAPYYLSNIPIPNFSISFQQTVEKLLMLAEVSIEESKNKYSKTQIFLLQELGITEALWQTKGVAINNKSFKESFVVDGRLDAEYYQPKYDILEKHINSYSKGVSKLSLFFKNIKEDFEKKDKGYNYIEIGDISISNGEIDYNFIITDQLPANAKIKVQKNDLLVSKVRPYRGAVAIINIDEENLIASGGFTVLRSNNNDYLIETLCVLLKSSPYKELMMKYNVGSSYPVIRDEDVLNLPIPNIPLITQQQIASLIQQSFQLRQQSKHLLEIAKQAVEIAIETDENTAMEFINANT